MIEIYIFLSRVYTKAKFLTVVSQEQEDTVHEKILHLFLHGEVLLNPPNSTNSLFKSYLDFPWLHRLLIFSNLDFNSIINVVLTV